MAAFYKCVKNEGQKILRGCLNQPYQNWDRRRWGERRTRCTWYADSICVSRCRMRFGAEPSVEVLIADRGASLLPPADAPEVDAWFGMVLSCSSNCCLCPPSIVMWKSEVVRTPP